MGGDRQRGALQWLDGLPSNRFHASVLVLGGTLLMSAGFDLQILAYAMPLVTREWGLSPVQGGAMLSYGLFGLMAGALGFGVVADRIGRKKALLTAVSAFSLLSCGASLAPGYGSFCILRFLTGVGIGGAFPLTVALISEYSPSRLRARFVTAAVSGFTLGWALAASVSMVVVPRYGWRLLFQLGTLPILLTPLLHSFFPESVRFLIGRSRNREAVEALGKVQKVAGLRPVSWQPEDLHSQQTGRGRVTELFRGRLGVMTLLVWSIYFLNTMALYGLSSWLPSLLFKEGFSLVRSYGYAMVQAGGSAAGGFLLGCLMDRFGRRPGLTVTYLLGGLSVIFLGSATTGPSLLLAGAATGVFVVGTPTALNVVSSEIYPTSIRTTGIAGTQAAGRIGSILGPVMGGVFQGMGLTFYQFFLLFSVPCFLCMFLVMLFPLSVRREPLEEITERFGRSTS